MPMTSVLKHSVAHYWRRPSLPTRQAWLWVQVWACVVAWVGTTVSAAPQQFPEASEDNHFVFRSDGTYSFSYDTGAGQHQSFRIETRDSTGRVSGRFGYVDPNGVLRITEYQADTEGYRANMEIYHLVSWFPRSPLLVGPLPQPPSKVEDLPDSREASQETTTGPVGTPLFFPPQGPVLIIGPLPKPLQPPRNLLDQEPPNLTEEALVGAPLDTVLPPPSDFLQGSAIEDLSESSPREILQDGIVNALLQGSLEDILQESVTDLLSSSILNTSLAISNNTQQNTELPSESPLRTVDDHGLDLPEGLEQMDSSLINPSLSQLPDEGSISRSSPENEADNSSTTAPASNRTLNVFELVLPERLINTSTQERQDNFKNSNISATGTTTTSFTISLISTTTSTTTSTNVSPISTVSSATTSTFPGVNKEITMTSQLTTSARPRLTTEATPHTPHQTALAKPRLTTSVRPQLITSARPQPTVTRVPQSTSSTRPQRTSAATPQLTASVRPELMTTNTPSVTTATSSRALPTPVGRPLSATVSIEHRDLRSGQEGDTSPSDTFIKTFPPVPALTYLPVGKERYDTPPDVYSYLPQTFNPFF